MTITKTIAKPVKIVSNLDAKRGPKAFIEEVNEDSVWQKAREIIARGEPNSFYIMNLQSVRDRLALWHKLLPSVKIHYAVKTNVDDQVLREVLKDGNGFDCASSFEIDRVLTLGANPEKIIFANPCKTEHMIRHAKKAGVRWFTFDSKEEASKIHRLFPEA